MVYYGHAEEFLNVRGANPTPRCESFVLNDNIVTARINGGKIRAQVARSADMLNALEACVVQNRADGFLELARRPKIGRFRRSHVFFTETSSPAKQKHGASHAQNRSTRCPTREQCHQRGASATRRHRSPR